MFGWQSLELWVVCPSMAHHLYVPKLWGRILPGKSRVKLNFKKNKVFLCLYKESDAEWKYLKGF